MNVGRENRNSTHRCIRVRHIKPISKCHWWLAFRRMPPSIRVIMAVSITGRRFIIHNRWHSRQSFIRVTIIIRTIIIRTFCHHRVWITNCLRSICQTVISTRIRHIFMLHTSQHRFRFSHQLWRAQRPLSHRHRCRTHISANITHFTTYRRRHRTPSRAMRARLSHRMIASAVRRLSSTASPVQYRSAAAAIIFARQTTTIITAPRQTTSITTTIIILVRPQRMAPTAWTAPVQLSRRVACSTSWWIQTNVKNSFTITIRCYFRHCQCPVQRWKSVCPLGKCSRKPRHVYYSWPCVGCDVWCHFKHFRRTINSCCYRFVKLVYETRFDGCWFQINPLRV